MSQENPKAEDKTPELIAEATDLSLDVARFIHDIEAGEIAGDCLELEEGGQESQKAEP